MMRIEFEFGSTPASRSRIATPPSPRLPSLIRLMRKAWRTWPTTPSRNSPAFVRRSGPRTSSTRSTSPRKVRRPASAAGWRPRGELTHELLRLPHVGTAVGVLAPFRDRGRAVTDVTDQGGGHAGYIGHGAAHRRLSPVQRRRSVSHEHVDASMPQLPGIRDRQKNPRTSPPAKPRMSFATQSKAKPTCHGRRSVDVIDPLLTSRPGSLSTERTRANTGPC